MTPPNNMPADTELRKQVHKLFGDSQVQEGGYQSCYDGKWLDMTNEVCAVADFIKQRDKARDAVIRELFVPVRGYEGLYEVSTFGNVKSIAGGRRSGRILKQSKRVGEYRFVTLCKDGKSTGCSIHRLVAEAFLSNPEFKRVVNHIDGNPANNRLDNLEWATYAENEQHSFDVLGKQSGRKGKFNEACYRGHPYSGENLHIYPDGRRACKECRRVYQQERRAKLKAELSTPTDQKEKE